MFLCCSFNPGSVVDPTPTLPPTVPPVTLPAVPKLDLLPTITPASIGTKEITIDFTEIGSISELTSSILGTRIEPEEIDPGRITAIQTTLLDHCHTTFSDKEIATFCRAADRERGSESTKKITVAGESEGHERSILINGSRAFLLLTHCRSQLDTLIGRGTSKTAKGAIDLQTGQFYVVTTEHMGHPSSIKTEFEMSIGNYLVNEEVAFRREAKAQTDCSSEYTVGLHLSYYDASSQKTYMVMDYCNGGILGRSHLGGYQGIKWLRDIIKAVDHIHTNGYVHGDLHLGNVFLHNTQIKLGDFGRSRNLHGMEASIFKERSLYGNLEWDLDCFEKAILTRFKTAFQTLSDPIKTRLNTAIDTFMVDRAALPEQDNDPEVIHDLLNNLMIKLNVILVEAGMDT